MKKFTPEFQKKLFLKLGYDPENYDPESEVENQKVFQVAVNALINGVDAQGEGLTADEMECLSTITGRN